MSSFSIKSKSHHDEKSLVNNIISKTLLIDSSWRDRNMYPFASDFVVPFNKEGTKGTLQSSIDPVANSVPYSIGTTSATTGTASFVVLPTGTDQDNFYIDDFLELKIGGISQFRPITSYTGTNKTAYFSSPFNVLSLEAGTTNLSFTVRKGKPIYQGIIGIGSTSSNINIGIDPSQYVSNNFIRITSGLNNGSSSVINSFTGTYVIVNKNFISPPVNGDTFEILPFSRDNVSPLRYSGTDAFSQPVAYEIKLNALTIPFAQLKVGYGGAIDSYPYLFVTLESASQKSSVQTIYTNNPNAGNSVFVVPIDISNYSVDSKFVTLYSPEPAYISFKPNDSLRFQVTLGNGQILKFSKSDSYSPAPPDPQLQISGIFSLKRM